MSMLSHCRLGLFVAVFALVAACDRSPAPPAATALSAAERVGDPYSPLQGAPNFRDLGGYRTADGQRVKSGLLYRTDALDKLTDADLRHLEQLNISRITDFRGDEEAAQAPDRLPASLTDRRVSMPMLFAGKQDYNIFVQRIMSGDTAGMNLDQMLITTNRQLVEQASPQFREWLHGLLQTGDGAQIFHCTAGKDRTGFAAAIFLLSLGVPQDVVMQDYLASNAYLEKKNTVALWKMRVFSLFRADTDSVRPLMGVDQRYLQAAFDTMTERYGSVDNYLREALGADDAFRAQLRAKFLEPVKS